MYQLFRHHVAAWRSRVAAPAQQHQSADNSASGWATAWPVEKVLLGRLKNSVAAAGGRLVIVMNDLNRQSPPDLSKWAAFENYCVSQEIPYLRLQATFQFRDVGERWQLAYDPHWNDRGHRLVAQAIRGFLERSTLLPVAEPRPTAARTDT